MPENLEALREHANSIAGRHLALGTALVFIRQAYELGWKDAMESLEKKDGQ